LSFARSKLQWLHRLTEAYLSYLMPFFFKQTLVHKVIAFMGMHCVSGVSSQHPRLPGESPGETCGTSHKGRPSSVPLRSLPSLLHFQHQNELFSELGSRGGGLAEHTALLQLDGYVSVTHQKSAVLRTPGGVLEAACFAFHLLPYTDGFGFKQSEVYIRLASCTL